jgi:hypothetical protein
MIRQQQAQITMLQANQQQTSSSAVDDSTPTSERSLSLPQSAPSSQQNISPVPLPGNIAPPRSRSPYGAISRQSSLADRSRGSSRHGSPALRPMSATINQYESNEWLPGSVTGRDESAFYQAETQNLTRENQMLKLRIRELGMLYAKDETLKIWLMMYRTAAIRAQSCSLSHALPRYVLKSR